VWWVRQGNFAWSSICSVNSFRLLIACCLIRLDGQCFSGTGKISSGQRWFSPLEKIASNDCLCRLLRLLVNQLIDQPASLTRFCGLINNDYLSQWYFSNRNGNNWPGINWNGNGNDGNFWNGNNIKTEIKTFKTYRNGNVCNENWKKCIRCALCTCNVNKSLKLNRTHYL